MKDELKLLTEDQIKLIAEKIREKFKVEKIILFGSYASGKPDKNSDIDLLVIIETDEKYPKLAAKIRLYLEENLGFSFPMDIFVRTPEEIENRIKMGDFFFKKILREGIIL
ncbi:MAG: nucleotidyltransferase domain-containing protein [Thermoanaerobaculia bacterium]